MERWRAKDSTKQGSYQSLKNIFRIGNNESYYWKNAVFFLKHSVEGVLEMI